MQRTDLKYTSIPVTFLHFVSFQERFWPLCQSATFVQMFVLPSEPTYGSVTNGSYKCFWIICKAQHRRRRGALVHWIFYCQNTYPKPLLCTYLLLYNRQPLVYAINLSRLLFNLFLSMAFYVSKQCLCQIVVSHLESYFPMEMSKLMGMDLTTSSNRWMLWTYFWYKLPGLSHNVHRVTQIS